MIDFDTYQKESARTRANDLDGKTAVMVAALGLAGEAGEVCDLIKKQHGHQHPLDREKLRLELGDTLFYLTWLADHHGFTMSEIAEANVDKLRARYPEGFSAEKSRNRDA